MSDDYLPPPSVPIDVEPVLEQYEFPPPPLSPENVARFQNWLRLIQPAVPEKPIPLPLPLPGSTSSHCGRSTAPTRASPGR